MSRVNELHRTTEAWRPAPFRSTSSRRRRLLALGRRTIDLQASSIWRDLKEQLPKVSGRVLDVGAGAQPYRSLIPPDADYHAIDAAQAAPNFGYGNQETEYFEGDNWPIANGTVDVVVSTETLEHVENPDRFLMEAHRVLRDHGKLILTVPFSARWHYIPQDFWRFTPSGLRVLLERNKFQDIHIQARGNAVTVAMMKCNALILPLLVPKRTIDTLPRLTLGVCLSPVVFTFAAIGQVSLRASGGADCLGYTIIARPLVE